MILSFSVTGNYVFVIRQKLDEGVVKNSFSEDQFCENGAKMTLIAVKYHYDTKLRFCKKKLFSVRENKKMLTSWVR